MIDPGTESALPHIRFVETEPSVSGGEEVGQALVLPEPRNGSERGSATIEVLKLDRDDLLELYRLHTDALLEKVGDVREAIDSGDLA